jgi:hypothetical protein
MSSVPLSIEQLEKIVEIISRDLLEQWAINDRFQENEIDQATKNSVEDTVFIINGFMSHLNETMLTAAEELKII